MRASAHLRAWSTLPQRIRAGCDSGLLSNCRADIGFASAHSRGLRRCDLFPRRTVGRSLPQRIRAGCDAATFFRGARWDDLCHSAFVRVATQMRELTVPLLHLCHSAFVRVATHCYKLCKIGQTLCLSAFARVATHPSATDTATCFFASAHSRGLRHVRRRNSFLPVFFATAHSRGLRRLFIVCVVGIVLSLPQRIRAGCDVAVIVAHILRKVLCHSAFARVATLP